jgi:hypothetical protein
MKRIVSMLFASAALVAMAIVATTSKHIVRSVYAQEGEHNECSNATLKGNYGFAFSGFSTPAAQGTGKGSQLLPWYGAGSLTFDGVGSVSGTFTAQFNGGGGVPFTYAAPYTVSPDCTVSMTNNPDGDGFAGVIIRGGAEILATDTTAPDTLNVNLKKQ